MIGDLERATFTNIEHQTLEFVIYTLMPWIVRWEQRLNMSLILAPQVYFTKFAVDGLLRGDVKTRFEAYQLGKRNGWLNSDEIRELEDMNPIPGGRGQEYTREANMVAVGSPGTGIAALDTRAKVLALNAALRVVRKETAALAKLAERNPDARAWEAGVHGMYAEHSSFIAGVLAIAPEEARRYAQERERAALEGGLKAVEAGEAESIATLAELALEERIAA
jgi:hypothetical protein